MVCLVQSSDPGILLLPLGWGGSFTWSWADVRNPHGSITWWMCWPWEAAGGRCVPANSIPSHPDQPHSTTPLPQCNPICVSTQMLTKNSTISLAAPCFINCHPGLGPWHCGKCNCAGVKGQHWIPKRHKGDSNVTDLDMITPDTGGIYKIYHSHVLNPSHPATQTAIRQPKGPASPVSAQHHTPAQSHSRALQGQHSPRMTGKE